MRTSNYSNRFGWLYILIVEVIGAAIALNLLFSIPLMTGVLITALDVLILLMFWNGKNMRGFELIVIVLVAVTAVCLFTITANSSVDWFSAIRGFLPSTAIVTEKGSIYVAVGIIGATVMPHNLYLHSSIVKYRSNRASRLGDVHEIDEEGEQFSPLPVSMKKKLPSILAMSWLDSTIALFFALLINSSILIISAANFNTGAIEVANIEDAYRLIKEILGPGFATLFAVGLLLAGQVPYLLTRHPQSLVP